MLSGQNHPLLTDLVKESCKARFASVCCFLVTMLSVLCFSSAAFCSVLCWHDIRVNSPSVARDNVRIFMLFLLLVVCLKGLLFLFLIQIRKRNANHLIPFH